ncbi:MAG: hypothetical protein ABFR82_05385 [Nitrospirota bacterium]
MDKNEKRLLLIAGTLVLCCTLFATAAAYASFVVREEGKVYIVDQTGARWDVTQAESIGFKPEKFQYGMGRNFFTPLDDSNLSDKPDENSKLRVIGITDGTDAKAYSVPKLSRHEIANSKIGEKPVAVGY